MYYQNNLVSTLVLLEVMKQFGVYSLIFSSSATVYGDTTIVPVTESFPLQTTNPYGRTKLMIEDILRDCTRASSLRAVLLRYFNPVGAHESGLMGEDPNGIPNNLLPYVAQVAIGQREKVSVFGGDYPTIDGTGVRDYIHVVDLAKAHVKALDVSFEQTQTCKAYNLGTGRGYSVLEVIAAFEEASGQEIPYQIVARRPGDIAESYADPTLANKELGWQAEKGLEEMLTDAWRWQSMNPKGFE
jgi:UDP-glucose 4-epimerase